METSLVQSLKLALVDLTGLSKDALHIYVGLAVYLLATMGGAGRARGFGAVLIVVAVACLGEALDLRDDLRSLGHWRWRASVHDVVNTAFWPSVLWLLARRR